MTAVPGIVVPVLAALNVVCGRVEDTFVDDIDPRCGFLVVNSGGTNLYVGVSYRYRDPAGLRELLGCEIEARGIAASHHSDNRRFLSEILYVTTGCVVRVTRQADRDHFDVPTFENLLSLGPQKIQKLGRHRVSGRVLAVMNDGSFLLRTVCRKRDYFLIVESVDAPPEAGAEVEAAGFPESNIYHMRFRRALWRPVSGSEQSREMVWDETPYALTHLPEGYPAFQSQFHGRIVRMKGRVAALPGVGNRDGRMRLEADGYFVPVDIGRMRGDSPGLSVGAVVELTGVCLMDIGSWRSFAAFPTIRGFFLVVRDAADIRVLAGPPWWTPFKLCVLIAILLLVITTSVVTILVLRRRLIRHSRQLLHEQIAKIGETLKIEERTRLAIELHDSIAQNLTGVAMQVEAAEDIATEASPALREVLALAAHTLNNCRDELRLCLWDLRSHSLDMPLMSDAIRKMLAPHLGGTALQLRFNVRRKSLTDTTAHAVLRIVRELVSNALRHGHASGIRIAGTLDGRRLDFSVADDGCGFDPAAVPGVSEGHFGLSGVRERVRKLGGAFELASAPGRGTRIVIRI